MIPQVQSHNHAPQIHAGKSLPQAILSQSGRSTLASGSSKEGFVMSTLNSVGRFFSWVFSGILYAITCGCCKKKEMPALPDDVKKQFESLQTKFDNSDGCEVVGAWGIGTTQHYDLYGDEYRDLNEDLAALGLDPQLFINLYSDELNDGAGFRKHLIHTDLSLLLDLKVDAKFFHAAMEYRIHEIKDPKISERLALLLPKVKSEGITNDLDKEIRQAERDVSLDMFVLLVKKLTH